MKCDVILAGVGGQGVLSVATIIAQAAVKEGLAVRQSEVHGMAQRGGSVESHVRFSCDKDAKVCAPIIETEKSDFLVPFHKAERDRLVCFLCEDGKDLIIRFHEMYGGRTLLKAIFNVPVSGWAETNLMEEALEPYHEGGVIKKELRPFEIATFRVKL